MSYLDYQKNMYIDLISEIDKKISEGKGIRSIRKYLIKKVNHIDYLKNYE